MKFFLNIYNFLSFFLRCVAIYEKKSIKTKITYIIYLFKNINLIEFIFFNFNRKKYNPIRSNNFKKYINDNKKKWKKLNINNDESKKTILVESFINQPAYILSNAIISLYLSKIFNFKTIGIIRSGDVKSEVIFRSFGIKKFIYFKNPNFLKRIFYVYKTFKLIKNINTIDAFIKFKYKDLDVGLSAYDSYVRYVGQPTLKDINPKLITILSEAISSSDFYFDLIKKDPSIEKSVHSEASFVPLNQLFQVCLKNKIEVFSRFGKESFTIRKYTKFNQRFIFRGTISQMLFDEVFKNHKNKCLKIIKKINKEKLKIGTFGMSGAQYKKNIMSNGKENIKLLDTTHKSSFGKKNKTLNKNDINQIFHWKKKKIVVFFLSFLTDANFPHGHRVNFRDSYSWIDFVLESIKKIDNVNWIIKEHPINKNYGAEKINFKKKIESLCKNFDHIKTWPLNLNNVNLLNITDVALTSSGTVGIEYSAYGIKTLFSEKSEYYHLDFMKMIKTKKEIKRILKNIAHLKKPTKTLIEKCQIYSFIREVLMRQKCSLLEDYSSSRSLDENAFWLISRKKVLKFNFKNDLFYKMFQKQIKYSLRHTINYDSVNFRNKIFKDYEN